MMTASGDLLHLHVIEETDGEVGYRPESELWIDFLLLDFLLNLAFLIRLCRLRWVLLILTLQLLLVKAEAQLTLQSLAACEDFARVSRKQAVPGTGGDLEHQLGL